MPHADDAAVYAENLCRPRQSSRFAFFCLRKSRSFRALFARCDSLRWRSFRQLAPLLLLTGCAEVQIGGGLFWSVVIGALAVVAILYIIAFVGEPLRLNPRFDRPEPPDSREWVAKMSDFGDPPGGQRGGL